MNGNGKLPRTNGWIFSKVDDMILKIGAGVATACIIAMVFFGMKVYAFMSVGERYTATMHEQSVKDAWREAREVFVEANVYEVDHKHLREDLLRIEAKLDRLLEQEK